jgi:hypothetical protein
MNVHATDLPSQHERDRQNHDPGRDIHRCDRDLAPSDLYEVVQYWYAAPPTVPASQVNPARPHGTDAHKCAWHTFFRRSLLQRCVPADARVDVYLWIRTATIAASMTA